MILVLSFQTEKFVNIAWIYFVEGAKKQSGIYFPTFALNPTLSVFWYEAATGCSFKVVFIKVNEYELVTYRESWIWASSSDELVNCSPRAPFGM